MEFVPLPYQDDPHSSLFTAKDLANYHISEQQIAEEQRWILAAQQDPRAFGKLYDFYYKRIFLFVFKRMEDEDKAADVTAQVFLKALTNLSKFSFQGVPFSAWLYRIALNEINMYFRADKSTLTESIEKTQIAEMLESEDGKVSDEQLQRLNQVLQKLSPDDMQLVSLRFFEEMSFKEVAEIVGITENNAKVKVYRILEKLRKWF